MTVLLGAIVLEGWKLPAESVHSFVYTPQSLADWASIAGVVISIIGFIVTVWGVWKTRSAADRAEAAAKNAVKSIRMFDAVADFSTAVSVMEEIKRLHRQNASEVILDRYASLKKLLITAREMNANLSDEQKGIITGLVNNLSGMERSVESARSKGKNLDVAKLNETVS